MKSILKKVALFVLFLLCIEFGIQSLSSFTGHANPSSDADSKGLVYYLGQFMSEDIESPKDIYGKELERDPAAYEKEVMGGYENYDIHGEDSALAEALEIYKFHDEFVDRIIEEGYTPTQAEVNKFVEDMFRAYVIDHSETAPETLSYLAVAFPDMVQKTLVDLEDGSTDMAEFKSLLLKMLQPVDSAD